ncbi:putative nucleotidyltransferase, Ribonuclease H [Helianthus annuus]|nr:putative nucleotidyltransferase, Ribonuclease H [Helianthus annuus]
MADGTRSKVLEDNLKLVQEAQFVLRKDVDSLLTFMVEQKTSSSKQEAMLQELLARSTPRFQKQHQDDGSGSSGGGSSGVFDHHDGYSILGRHKPAPVQLPRFTGDHPERWVAQALRYFDFYSISEADRLTIASFYLDSEAADWYDWFQRHHHLTGWQDFTVALIKRFRSHDLEEPEGLLAKLQQSTTVADYRSRFEAISNRTMALPPVFLIQCFISGLRADIKHSVLVHKPQSLEDAMTLAQNHEQRILLEKGLGRLSIGSSKPILPTPNLGPTPTSVTRSTNPNILPPNLGIRRLTPTEIAQKRAMGLCYRCDERYSKDHKCKTTPQLLFFDEDPVPPPDPPLPDTMGDAQLAEKLQLDDVALQSSISYNALAGGCSSTTLRFQGFVKGKPVQVLLDGGSTHCFVQTRVANFLNLPVEVISPFSVLVGSGERLPCSGIARQVELFIQSQVILVDFYVLPLQGWDMVLGVSWLSTLGPVITNYATSTFEFNLAGNKVLWTGDTKPVVNSIEFNGLKHLARADSVGALFHLSLLPSNCPTEPTYPADLSALLDEFPAVFQPPQQLPPAREQDHRINLLPDKPPVSVKPYRYPHFQKQEIERLVAEMLHQGLIRPSTSPFSSPVLLVRKKDGTWRFCVDYRALNAITVRDRFPIPSIDELFDELHGAKFFSKLDLLAGYHQIRLHTGDEFKTAFRTHEGHYEFLVLPFGLTNAPSTFQRLMNEVFRPFLRKFVLVFFDDILIYSTSWAQHLSHIRCVLQLLLANNLVAKRSKCVFGQQRIGYLGHFISSAGVAVDPEKITSIQNWPTPTSIKDIRSFLGLAGYYRRFIRHFAQVASPLTDLLKKSVEPFEWSSSAQEAFVTLKHLLSSAPVLRLPDFSKPFILETDASGTGIGAVLSQEHHPLAFFSQKLSDRLQQASAYTREMYAITQSIAKWRQYLLGHRFTIITDQQSLRNLNDQVIQTPEQHKWLGKLLGFDFDIIYRPGKHNEAADALSRLTHSSFLALSTQHPSLLDSVRRALIIDPSLRTLQNNFLKDPNMFPGYCIKDDLLLYHNRLVIPSDPSIRQLLLREFHSSTSGGHSGISRTYHRLSSSFYWPGMRKDVKLYIEACHTCQEMKHSTSPPSGLLQPLPLPSMVFEGIAMDFITGLPVSQGKSVIMVVVDRLSKYGHFFGLPTSFTTSTVVTVFVNEIVRLHGVPLDIVTDRDPRFMSTFWKELHSQQGTTLSFSTAYHPQSDGQTEALNKCLELYLRCFVADYPKDWVRFLPWAEFWYNTSYHHSTKMTPFEVLYGRPPPTITRYIRDSTGSPLLAAQLRERDDLLLHLKANLSKAQATMKTAADKHRKDVSFEVGDWVYIKLQPYRQHSIRLRRHNKLGRRFFGPYQIVSKVGPVAYKLNLPDSAKIHPVIHVSLLRKCIGKPEQQVTPLHLVDSNSTVILQPQDFLDHRTITKGDQTIQQTLVSWEGFPTSEATWEDNSALLKQFPALHLEDKVEFKRGGNVMNTSGPNNQSSEPKVITKREPSSRIRKSPNWKDFVVNYTSGGN